MSTFKNILAIAAAIAAAASMQARNLSTQVDVDRNIIPEERAADRPTGYAPTLYAPRIGNVTLLPAEYAGTAVLQPSFNTLDPAVWPMALKPSQQRGYAVLGYGPVYNLAASAGYRIVNTSTSRVDAWMQFDGRQWHGYTPAADRALYRDNTLTIGADGHHRFGRNSQLSVRADYTHAWINQPNYGEGFRQGINMASAKAGWWSRVGALVYHANASWQTFGFNAVTPGSTVAPVENLLGLDLDASLATSRSCRVGLKLAGEMLTADNTLGLISAVPAFSFRTEALRGHLGVNLQGATGTDDRKFRIAPDVAVDWTPSDVVTLGLGLKGGSSFNTLRAFYNYTPWIPSYVPTGHRHMPVDATLKLTLGPVNGFSAQLSGGYAKAEDWMMLDGATDVSGFRGGMELRYHPADIINVYAAADLTQQAANRGYYAWSDHAKYVIKTGAETKPLKQLTVAVDWEYRGRRMAYPPDGEHKLGAISDLQARASWQFNDRLSVFANGRNLLCRHYEILPGMEAPTATALVGVSLKF